MTYPDFFNHVPSITLKDPLSDLLGSFDHGDITFTYLDIVKASGHSCPTVAGAYLICFKALEALYPNEVPQRGNIVINFRVPVDEGTIGVIANVLTHITGASDEKGFKGLQGKFARHDLLKFNTNIFTLVRFTRSDISQSVDVNYHPEVVPPNPKTMPLMQKILAKNASIEDKTQFGLLWQERVSRILIENFNNKELVTVTKV